MTLPAKDEGWTAFGAATPNGDVIVSGAGLRLIRSSGDRAHSFGIAGRVTPSPPEGGKFWPSDFTVDRRGRILVVGTAEFPATGEGLAGPIEPSAVRILRFLRDGRPDLTFGKGGVIETDLGLPAPRDEEGEVLQPEASMQATGIAVDSLGRIVVTGGADLRLGPACQHDIFDPVPVTAPFVARLRQNGVLDANFSGDGIVGGRRLDETPLGAAAIGDPVISPSGAITYHSTSISLCHSLHGRYGVAQLTPDGKTRKGLGRKGAVGGYFTALAAESDGSVVALARMGWTEGEPFRARLIRIGPDGEIDRSFSRDGNAYVKLGSVWGNQPDSLAIDGRGRVLMGGTLVTGEDERERRSILMVRLSADGRQEMDFGPNGRVVTSFPSLIQFGQSDLFFDPQGRVVTVHQYETRKHAEQGARLVLARYLLSSR